MVLKKKIFLKFVIDFFQNRYVFLFERDGARHLNKLESPSPNDTLCEVLIEICPLVLEKMIFQIRQWIFTIL